MRQARTTLQGCAGGSSSKMELTLGKDAGQSISRPWILELNQTCSIKPGTDTMSQYPRSLLATFREKGARVDLPVRMLL